MDRASPAGLSGPEWAVQVSGMAREGGVVSGASEQPAGSRQQAATAARVKRDRGRFMVCSFMV